MEEKKIKKEDMIITNIRLDQLKSLEWLTNAENELKFQRVIIPTVDIDPDTGLILGGLEQWEEVPVDNADIDFVCPNTRIQIKQILGDAALAVAVRDSDLTLTLVKEIAGAALVINFITTAVSLQSGEDGSVMMFPGSELTLYNDNGAITSDALTLTSGKGVILEPPDTITLAMTNKNAADRLRLQIYYEILEE